MDFLEAVRAARTEYKTIRRVLSAGFGRHLVWRVGRLVYNDSAEQVPITADYLDATYEVVYDWEECTSTEAEDAMLARTKAVQCFESGSWMGTHVTSDGYICVVSEGVNTPIFHGVKRKWRIEK